MTTVNMLDAKTRLSQLVDAVESGAEPEIVIARNGKPAARLVPLQAVARARLGVAKGRFRAPADPAADDEAVAALFRAGA
jgi:prevent-host-death family protein